MQKSNYKNSGFEVWNNYLDSKKADNIKKKLDHFFDINQNLGPAVNVANLEGKEVHTRGAQRKEKQKNT